MTIAAIILMAVAAIVWLATLAMLTGLRSSDAAGNGLTVAFSAIAMIVQWLLIAALVLAAGPKGQKLAVLCVVVLAAAASWTGMGLLNDSFYRAKWPLILPAVAPFLVVALLYRGRLLVSVSIAAALLAIGLGTTAYRERHRDRDRAARDAAWQQAEQDQFARLTPASPIEQWLEHTGPGNERRARALAAIRQSPSRQADIERLMRQGSHYLTRDLPELGVEATEPICAAGRRCLRELIDDMARPSGGTGPIYLAEGARIQEYKDGIRWLVENGCPCRQELDDLAAAVEKYEPTPERAKFAAFVAALRAKMLP